MVRAFVFFNVDSGSEDKILQELKKIEGIQEAYISYEQYDLIARVKADTMEKLKDATHQVRMIKNVRSTLTLLMIEE